MTDAAFSQWWAPADSRLGALQRGRGDGDRAARAAGAADEVLTCVLADPRWDRQVESRDRYYARLLCALGAEVDAVARHLDAIGGDPDADRSDAWLALGVLAEMARRCHAGARTSLGEIAAHPRLWLPCLEELAGIGGHALVDAVVSPAAARAFAGHAAPSELDEAIASIDAPWAAWAQQVPAIAARLAGAAPGSARTVAAPPAFDGSQSTAEILAACVRPGLARAAERTLAARDDPASLALLEHTARAGTGPARAAALAVLGRRGRVDHVDEAEAFLRAEATDESLRPSGHRARRGWLRYLEVLPAAVTLPLARRWFDEPWPLSLAAEAIFVRHATGADRPALEAAGVTALAAGAMYRLCSVVDALGGIGDAASIAFLCDVCHHVPYSYARTHALEALRPHADVDRVRALLTDALWDCEAGAYAVACEVVDPTATDVRARLAELATDPREDADIREDARRRLAGEPLDGD